MKSICTYLLFTFTLLASSVSAQQLNSEEIDKWVHEDPTAAKAKLLELYTQDSDIEIEDKKILTWYLAFLNKMERSFDSCYSYFELYNTLPLNEEESGNYKIESCWCKANVLPDKADSLYKDVIDFSRRTKNGLGLVTSLNDYAIIKQRKGQLYEATQLRIEAFENAEHPFQKSAICTNVASLFITLENYELAEQYLEEGLGISEKENYSSSYAKLAYLKGILLLKKGEEVLGEKQILGSLEDLKQIYFNKETHICTAFASLIDLYVEQGRLAEAKTFVIEGESSWKTLEKSESAFVQFALSKAHFHIMMNELAKAKSTLAIFQDVYKEVPEELVAQYFEISATLEKAENQFAAALRSRKNAKASFDNVYKRLEVDRIKDIEANYNRKEQEIEINSLNKTNTLQQNRIIVQRRAIAVLLAFLALISFLSYTLYKMSKRVRAQSLKLTKTTNEKDLLLREIHHRVKNNLQLVSSLLGLQSRYVTDEQALDALRVGKDRVRSMALIHQDLYNKEDIKSVNAKEYFEKLTQGLLRSYEDDLHSVHCTINAEKILVDVDTLIPLGLITNEILTRIFRNKGAMNQEIEMDLNLLSDDQGIAVMIESKDQTFDPLANDDAAFGTELLHTLNQQIQAKMNVSNANNNTQVIIRVPYLKMSA